MAERKPTPTGYVILGLLSFGQPLAGYEMRQWALGLVGHFYPAPAQSQIYRELAMLEETGRISSTPIAQSDRPDKIVYHLTPVGREALQSWAEAELAGTTSLKHQAILRVFLGHNATTASLIEILEVHKQTVLAALDELETLSAALADDEETGLAAIAADWTAEIYRGDLRGVEQALKTLTNNGKPLPAPGLSGLDYKA